MSRLLRLFEPLSRSCSSWSRKLAEGPSLESFIANSTTPQDNYEPTEVPYLTDTVARNKKVFFEVSLDQSRSGAGWSLSLRSIRTCVECEPPVVSLSVRSYDGDSFNFPFLRSIRISVGLWLSDERQRHRNRLVDSQQKRLRTSVASRHSRRGSHHDVLDS